MKQAMLLLVLALSPVFVLAQGDDSEAESAEALLELLSAPVSEGGMPLDRNGIPLDESLQLTDRAVAQLWTGLGITDSLLLALAIYTIRIHLRLAELRGRLQQVRNEDEDS